MEYKVVFGYTFCTREKNTLFEIYEDEIEKSIGACFKI